MTNTTACTCGHAESYHDIAPTGCVYGIEEGNEPCPCAAYEPAPPTDVERCEKCGQERTANGGDVHCVGDCDDWAHGQENGCHRFTPPPQPAEQRTAEREVIALPVTYDGEYNGYIRDAEGRVVAEISPWQYNWPAQGGKPDDEIQPENGHAVGQQIADALNERDRQAKILAELIEAAQRMVGFCLHCDMDGLEQASEPERTRLEAALAAAAKETK